LKPRLEHVSLENHLDPDGLFALEQSGGDRRVDAAQHDVEVTLVDDDGVDLVPEELRRRARPIVDARLDLVLAIDGDAVGVGEHPLEVVPIGHVLCCHLDAQQGRKREQQRRQRGLRRGPPARPLWLLGAHGAHTSEIQPNGARPALVPVHNEPPAAVSVKLQNIPTGSPPSTIGVASAVTQGWGARSGAPVRA